MLLISRKIQELFEKSNMQKYLDKFLEIWPQQEKRTPKKLEPDFYYVTKKLCDDLSSDGFDPSRIHDFFSTGYLEDRLHDGSEKVDK